MKIVKDQWLPGVGDKEGGMDKVKNRGFEGSENTLHDTVMVGIYCHTTCPNPYNIQHLE